MNLPPPPIAAYKAQWPNAAHASLSSSDMEPLPMADLLALADADTRSMWDSLTLGYTSAAGLAALREEIAGTYHGVSPEEVLCFAGSGEGIFAPMAALFQPGDHAVVLTPAYPPLALVPRAMGADVTEVPLDEARGWQLEVDAVRAALRPNTRALVVNFPHNPTGALPDKETFSALMEMAEERGITVYADEVFRTLEYDPANRLPAAVEAGPHAVSLGAMAKPFGLAGLRVGWIATHDRSLLRRAAEMKGYLSMGNSAPAEILSLIALRARETLLARSRAILEANLAHLDRFFEDWRQVWTWTRPRAGTVAFPRLLTGNIETFSAGLAMRHGTLILPGSVFGTDAPCARIGFGRADLPERLADFKAVTAQRYRC